jgi:tetrahydromethanopterin S-methyltransferase subunit G|tara:strand:+ start:233 stop:541 length:309 start_codon:yes stop_codon:yes gene_type:complete
MKPSLEITPEITMTTNARLDRIEEKLDSLTEAMIALARAEEKIAGIKQAQDSGWERMNHFSKKLDSIEEQVRDNANTVSIINKLFWVAVVAISGSIAAQMWM